MEPAPLSSLQEEVEGEPAGEDSSAFSAAAVPPRPATHHALHKYAPLDWSAYFDEERRVVIPGTDDVFNVYTAGSEGPVVFCLHGGGYSGLSFALAARQMKDKARVVSMDLRGHGKSTTSNDSDLSIEVCKLVCYNWWLQSHTYELIDGYTPITKFVSRLVAHCWTQFQSLKVFCHHCRLLPMMS